MIVSGISLAETCIKGRYSLGTCFYLPQPGLLFREFTELPTEEIIASLVTDIIVSTYFFTVLFQLMRLQINEYKYELITTNLISEYSAPTDPVC